MFTKFGIWEKEVSEFISTLNSEAKLSKDDLKKWLYEDGIMIFVEAQGTTYNQDVKDCIERYKHRPLISATYMLGNKFNGFQALGDKFVANFGQNDNTLKLIITDCFYYFLGKAVSQHRSFYSVQADVTTELNLFLDKNPQTPPVEIGQFVTKKLEEYKIKQPELAQEIEDHLLLMKEYGEHKMKQSKLSMIAQGENNLVVNISNNDSILGSPKNRYTTFKAVTQEEKNNVANNVEVMASVLNPVKKF